MNGRGEGPLAQGHVRGSGDYVDYFEVEGPITCMRVEGNRASIKYRFRRASGPGAPPQGGGVQVYIEDNGQAAERQAGRPRGNRAARAAGRLRRRRGSLHRSDAQPRLDAARVRRLRRARRGLSPAAAQVGLERARRVVQLPPGDPDHAPARGLEAAVADAVVLEGVRDGVKGAAVELDEEALLRPDAVDLDSPR